MLENIFSLSVDLGTRIWYIVLFGLPFGGLIYAFIRLKIWMRVGGVDMWEFAVFYIFGMIVLTFFIVYLQWGDPVIIYADWSGVLLGLPFGLKIFSLYPGEVTLIKFKWIDFESNPPQCNDYESHTYWIGEKQYIIWYDYGYHETFWDFIKRMFGFRTELEWVIDPGFPFIDHGVNEVYFIEHMEESMFFKSYIHQETARDEQGRIKRDAETGEIIYEEFEIFEKWFGIKKKKIRKRLVTPVTAQRWSLTNFLTRFKDYKTMSEEIAQLYELNMTLQAQQRSNSYKDAGRMVFKWMTILGEGMVNTSKKLEQMTEPQDGNGEYEEEEARHG